ncbi:MAG: aldehyde dehydrogenase, partial [Proteobacteria bacterium]|nr:aldehyde dehydrogenase [Pseudomonadota bacterium]
MVMLQRREVVSKLNQGRGDALMVTGLGSSSYDLHAAGDDDRNFYLWGAMGGAAMTGLGVAMAQPDKHIIVLTGDGE